MKVALTFDDGPNDTNLEEKSNGGRKCEVTNELLDVLKETGVVATFFVVGKNVELCDECITRMMTEGHLVGNHSQTHPAGGGQGLAVTCKTYETVLKEITDCSNTIYTHAISGAVNREYRPRYFRCPEGNYDIGEDWVGKACKETGMVNVGKDYTSFKQAPYHVNWDFDDLSWREEENFENIQTKVKEEFEERYKRGSDLVVLSHDHFANHAKTWTEIFINDLKRIGSNIQFVRIDELVGKRDNLEAGEYLLPGQAIESLNGKYRLVFQRDTNLVLYLEGGKKANPVWATGQIGGDGGKATVTDQGEVEISNSSGTSTKFAFPHEGGVWKTGSRLVLDNNGKFNYQ